MQQIKKMSRWIVPIALFAFPVVVFGAAIPTPNVVGGGQALSLDEILDLVRTVANWLTIIAIIIAVIFIIWGGIVWMAARGNEDMAQKGKDTIKNGILGAVVVLAVGVILQTLAALVSRNFFNF